MPLINCKTCGSSVADSAATCPHCGVDTPGRVVGRVIFGRDEPDGCIWDVKISSNGQEIGRVRPGGVLVLELPPGRYNLRLKSGLAGGNAEVVVEDGRTQSFLVSFSGWGGIKLSPA